MSGKRQTDSALCMSMRKLSERMLGPDSIIAIDGPSPRYQQESMMTHTVLRTWTSWGPSCSSRCGLGCCSCASSASWLTASPGRSGCSASSSDSACCC